MLKARLARLSRALDSTQHRTGVPAHDTSRIVDALQGSGDQFRYELIHTSPTTAVCDVTIVWLCICTHALHALLPTQRLQWNWSEHEHGIIKMRDVRLTRVGHGAIVQHALLRMAVAMLHVAEVWVGIHEARCMLLAVFSVAVLQATQLCA